MPKGKEGASWPRLEVYLPDEEMRRRVKLAAAARNLKISEYCLQAIEERLEQDGMQSSQTWERQIEELRSWQKQYRARLRGRKIRLKSV